jgi:molecular chaperone GrpE
MSDPAAADRAGGPAGGPAALTPAAVEALIAEFRGWLASGRREPAGGPAVHRPAHAGRSPEPVDLSTLVGQFTALRHEVNLQTRAARAATEQAAEAVRLLANPPVPPDDGMRSVARAVVDIADVLALSLRQAEKLRDAAAELVEEVAEKPGADAPRSPRPGFFARLFGRPPGPPPDDEPPEDPAADKLRQLVAAAADGYALSLRRVERLLPTLELEVRPCYGEPFDPDWMEAVEVVGDTGEPPGTVVEEVRPGYLWRGQPFRPAQVKVAR